MQSLENIMLITDLDGTLLPSSKEISAADAAAISQFRAKGGKFAIATGRTLQAAQRYLNKLKPNIPVILFNGAAIYDPVTEKWLYTEKLPADAVAVTRQVLDAFPTDYPDGQKETESTYGYRYAVTFRDANNQEIGRCTVRNDNQLVCGERVYAIDCTPIVAQIEAAISAQK